MPVNPYDDRKVSLRRPHGNGDLDIVRASYTRLKAYAHLQPMTKIPVKLQSNQHKTVGGDAYTLLQVSIHFDCKMTKFIL